MLDAHDPDAPRSGRCSSSTASRPSMPRGPRRSPWSKSPRRSPAGSWPPIRTRAGPPSISWTSRRTLRPSSGDRRLCARDVALGVLGYEDGEVVGWAAVAPPTRSRSPVSSPRAHAARTVVTQYRQQSVSVVSQPRPGCIRGIAGQMRRAQSRCQCAHLVCPGEHGSVRVRLYNQSRSPRCRPGHPQIGRDRASGCAIRWATRSSDRSRRRPSSLRYSHRPHRRAAHGD